MRGEIYVMSLLRISSRAEDIAAEHMVGPTMHVNPALELTDPDRIDLAELRFEELADVLEVILRPRPPELFGEADFERLLRTEVQLAISRPLGCAPGDVLASLFDPVGLERALDELGTVRPGDADSERLIYAMFGCDGFKAYRLLYGFGEHAWGNELLSRRWLLDSAVDVLLAEGARRGWGDEPGRILSGLIAEAGQSAIGPSLRGGESYTALSIIYLRRLLARLVTELYQESESYVREAVGTAPGAPGLLALRGWLELYERGNLARGLVLLCGGTQPLRTALSNGRCEVRRVTENPALAAHLKVDGVTQFAKRKARIGAERWFVTFTVGAQVKPDQPAVPILNVTDLPREDFERLKPAIERLTGEHISAGPALLGERLLDATVPVGGTFDGALRSFVERNIDLIAQTIVLTGQQHPIDAAVPWSQRLQASTGYDVQAGDLDADLPADTEQLVMELTQEYASQRKQLTIDRQSRRVLRS
jgi:hypothetical protein